MFTCNVPVIIIFFYDINLYDCMTIDNYYLTVRWRGPTKLFHPGSQVTLQNLVLPRDHCHVCSFCHQIKVHSRKTEVDPTASVNTRWDTSQ